MSMSVSKSGRMYSRTKRVQTPVGSSTSRNIKRVFQLASSTAMIRDNMVPTKPRNRWPPGVPGGQSGIGNRSARICRASLTVST